jgi:hypothetical protein
LPIPAARNGNNPLRDELEVAVFHPAAAALAEAGCHAIDIPGQTAAELAEEIARPWNAPLPIDMAILIRR